MSKPNDLAIERQSSSYIAVHAIKSFINLHLVLLAS